MEEVAEELKAEGVSYKRVDIVPLIENPTICRKENLEQILKAGEGRISRFSIGSNDMSYLAQVGKARGEAENNPFMPSVLTSINNVVEVAHDNGLNVVICGGAGGKNRFTPVFLALGVDGFSMIGASMPDVKKVVRKLDSKTLTQQKDNMLQQSFEDLDGLYEHSQKIADAVTD